MGCLEQLRADKNEVSFLGYTFDLSFIPLAQSLPFLDRYQKVVDMQNNGTSKDILYQAKLVLAAHFCMYNHTALNVSALSQCTTKELDTWILTIAQVLFAEIKALPQKKKKKQTSVSGKKSQNDTDQFADNIDLFCVTYSMTEKEVLAQYNLTAFYRKLANGVKYKLRLANIPYPEDSENMPDKAPITRDDHRKLMNLFAKD
jgi:hypothetical protein